MRSYNYLHLKRVYREGRFIYLPLSVKVEIIKRFKNSCTVKLLETHTDGRPAGTVLTVRAKNVKD